MILKNITRRMVTVLAMVFILLFSVNSVEAKSEVTSERIAGANRIETSVEIGRKYFSVDSNVILANGYTLVDALSCGYYATIKDEPIFVISHDGKNEVVTKYFKENFSDLTILGGNGAISKGVEGRLVASANGKEELLDTMGKLEFELLRQVMNRPEEITIDYYGTGITNTDDLINLLRRLQKTSNYDMGNLWNWLSRVTNQGGYYKLELYTAYNTTDEEEAFIQSEVERITKLVVKPKMSEFEKVRVLHDYVVDNTTYNINTKGPRGSAHTLFNEKQGVCNAYALAMSRLLEHNHIDNRFVVGDGYSFGSWGLHSWNKVKVDGVWYNLDTTWNFPKENNGLHSAYYYFLVSDARFYKDHKPAHKEYLPKSTDTRYDGQYDGNFTNKL